MIPLRAIVPYVGYSDFRRIWNDFLKKYDPDYVPRRIDVLENTVAYFVLGVLVVLWGRVYPFILVPELELVLLGCIVAAAFEIDIMMRLRTRFLNWKSFEKIPVEVVNTSGRRLVALGMYHATIFFLTGAALTFAIFPVP
jgi:hypothetical protein